MALSSSAVAASTLLFVIAEVLGPGRPPGSPVASAAESTWMHLSELDLGLSSTRMIFVAGLDISEESASSAETSESECGRLCILAKWRGGALPRASELAIQSGGIYWWW